ncbi:unnamed protein product, partial [Ixodes hexagonus]
AASYKFGVCSKRRVALGSDDGLFSGVPAAVQQIAHLLGITWDEKRNRQGCTPDDGHVMSRNGESTKFPTFSHCSKETWELTLQMSLGDETCFKLNNTSTTTSSQNSTPYHFFGCETSCQNITPTGWTYATDLATEAQEGIEVSQEQGICKCGCCPHYQSYLNGTKSGAPDGMPCGPDQV